MTEKSMGPIVGWPVGARLRFQLDADLQPKYHYLRGTPVVIVSDIEWSPPSDGFLTWSWRQQALAFAYSVYRSGSAQPSHLEPIPDIPMLPSDARQAELPSDAAELAVH